MGGYEQVLKNGVQMAGASSPQVMIFADETVEDLQRGNFRLIQKKDGFRHGEDAVLLAHFAARQFPSSFAKPLRYLEFGSQSGVVSILFQALCPQAEGVGIELFSRQVEVMRRNIRLNGLAEALRTVQADIRSLSTGEEALPAGVTEATYDLIICNPPYGVPERGFMGKQGSTGSESDLECGGPRSLSGQDLLAYEKRAAREEVAVNFKEICQLAFRLLKSQGRFIFSHRPERLPELMVDLAEARLMPKCLLTVQPQAGKKASTILLVATKDGRPGSFQLLPPLVVRDSTRHYTAGMKAFIGPTAAYTKRAGDPLICYEEEDSALER